MLAHENLQVYGKAVKVAAQTFTLCSGWDKRHALVDQQRFLHTAHSALVKTAAYLDLCFAKGLNPQGADTTGKQVLDRIAAMLTRMEQAATK